MKYKGFYFIITIFLFLFLNLSYAGAETAEEFNNKGIDLYSMGRYDDAIKYFNRALEIDPSYIKALSNKGVVLNKLGRYEEAIKCFDKVIKVNPNLSTAWNHKGEALSSLRQYEEAIRCFDKALEIDPAYDEARSNKEEALKFPGNYATNATETIGYKSLPDITPTPSVNKISYNGEKSSEGPSIEVKNLPASGETFKTSENRIKVEGTAKALNELKSFEISIYSGKSDDEAEWREKLDGAEGKKEYPFTRDMELKSGTNFISIRAVDSAGKEAKKIFCVIYTPVERDKWAVVIGIKNYASPVLSNLRYSDTDAQSMYDYLINKAGFKKDHVLLLLNEHATLEEVRAALGIFLAEKARKDDLVFIYYSGHGAPEVSPNSNEADGLTKYIVTYDAKPDRLFATALPMEDINKIFSRISSKRIVFFIDSCYSGSSGGKTFCNEIIKAGNISDDFLTQLSSGTGRLLISASSANEVAMESDNLGHGIFTYYLLEGLEGKADMNKNGYITVDEIYQYVHEKVSDESKNRQHPVKKGEAEGEIILGRGLRE